jgi:uncharacterized protein YegL
VTGYPGQDPKTALVDELQQVAVMQDPDGRALVLGELAERGHRLDAMRYARDRHDIWAIVTACMRQDRALDALVDVLRGIEGPTSAVTQIARIIEQMRSGPAPAGMTDTARPPTSSAAETGTSIRARILEHGQPAGAFWDMRRDALVCGRQLGAGARGRVFEVLNHPGIVYKEYISGPANQDVLAELILLAGVLDSKEKEQLDSCTSWPLARITEDGRVVGCVMRSLTGDFYVKTEAGQRPAFMSYLCYPRRQAWRKIHVPGTADRLEIARQIVALFGFLQRHSLVIGDVSAQNLLWTLNASPRVVLLGCDALRKLGGQSALPEGETPGWEDPLLDSRNPDSDSDNYKLALVIGRILSQAPHVRPGEPLGLRGDLPPAVARRVSECFAAAARPAGERPPPELWMDALSASGEVLIRWPSLKPPGPRPVLPLYVVCDVTHSAQDSNLLDVGGIADAFLDMSCNPYVAEKVRACMVTFSDDAKVVLPLSDLSDGTQIPPLTAGSKVRRYGPVFTLMKDLIQRDVQRLREEDQQNVLRPVMIFISGGPPTDEWKHNYLNLVDSGFASRPNIFTWAVGDAEPGRVAEIATDYDFTGSAISPADLLQEYARTLASSDVMRPPRTAEPEAARFQAIDLEYLDDEPR